MASETDSESTGEGGFRAHPFFDKGAYSQESDFESDSKNSESGSYTDSQYQSGSQSSDSKLETAENRTKNPKLDTAKRLPMSHKPRKSVCGVLCNLFLTMRGIRLLFCLTFSAFFILNIWEHYVEKKQLGDMVLMKFLVWMNNRMSLKLDLGLARQQHVYDAAGRRFAQNHFETEKTFLKHEQHEKETELLTLNYSDLRKRASEAINSMHNGAINKTNENAENLVEIESQLGEINNMLINVMDSQAVYNGKEADGKFEKHRSEDLDDMAAQIEGLKNFVQKISDGFEAEGQRRNKLHAKLQTEIEILSEKANPKNIIRAFAQMRDGKYRDIASKENGATLSIIKNRHTALFGMINPGEPESLINPLREPGSCVPFKPSNGEFEITFAKPSKLGGFGYEHVAFGSTPERNSAPREIMTWGIKPNGNEFLLNKNGTVFVYRDESVYEDFAFEKTEQLFSKIRIKVLSNYGHKKFTCLYKFKVYSENPVEAK